MSAGAATPEGTAQAVSIFGDAARDLGSTGLRCTPVGLEILEASDDLEARVEAVREGLRSGLNVLRVGASPTVRSAIGAVLGRLEATGTWHRAGLILLAEVEGPETVPAATEQLGSPPDTVLVGGQTPDRPESLRVVSVEPAANPTRVPDGDAGTWLASGLLGRPTGPGGLRLFDPLPSRGSLEPELEATLVPLRKLEARWATGLGRELAVEGGGDAVDLFRWGQEMTRILPEIRDPARWEALRTEVIAPHVGQASATLLRVLEGDTRSAFATWWEAYGTALHRTFQAAQAAVQQQSQIERAVQGLESPFQAAEGPLSSAQRVLGAWLGRELPGLACVLVDVRHPREVADLMGVRERLA